MKANKKKKESKKGKTSRAQQKNSVASWFINSVKIQMLSTETYRYILN
jgi:hypothetical protein